MPYVADTYSLPAGTVAVSNATANSTHVNSRFSDLESAQNAVRPVVAGGTGVASLADLITALQALGWTFTDDVDLTGATVSGIYSRTAATATTSGTSFDFTGIPSWANEVIVNFRNVSLTLTNTILVQLGDSGGIETTGYESGYGSISSAGAVTAGASITSGHPVAVLGASDGLYGALNIVNYGGNNWNISGSLYNNVGSFIYTSGTKGLSDVLTQLRVTVSGAANFDGGGISVAWRR